MLYGCGPCHSEMRDGSRWYFVTSFPKEGAFRVHRRPISARCESGIVPLISRSAFYGSARNLTATPPVAIFLGPATPRRWQVWYRGYFLGSSRHWAPVPKTHKIPLRTARVSCRSQDRFDHFPSGHRSVPIVLACPPAARFPTRKK